MTVMPLSLPGMVQRVSFERYQGIISNSNSQVYWHLIFDIKMDLTCKVQLVVGGHKTPDPVATMYVGVVTRESV